MDARLLSSDPAQIEAAAAEIRAQGPQAVDDLLQGCPSLTQPGGSLSSPDALHHASLRMAMRWLSCATESAEAQRLRSQTTRLNLNHHDAALLTDLRSFSHLSALQELVAWQPVKLASLEGISKLPALRQLSLPGARSLRSADGLPASLEVLNLRRSGLESARGLDSPTLRTVDLSECRRLRSLSGLGPGVHTLSAEYCEALHQLDALADCRALRSLRISDMVLAADLRPLQGLPELQHLALKRCLLTDLGVLETLPALLNLDLSAAAIEDLNSLRAWVDRRACRIAGPDKGKVWEQLSQGLEARQLTL